MNTYEKIDENGSTANVQPYQKTGVIAATVALTDADNGRVFEVATDALVITLPSVASNLRYTFVNTGADGANIITISPAAADGIHGTITLAGTVVQLSGTVNKDLINTKATSFTGNTVVLQGTSAGWVVISSTGIWASQA